MAFGKRAAAAPPTANPAAAYFGYLEVCATSAWLWVCWARRLVPSPRGAPARVCPPARHAAGVRLAALPAAGDAA